MPLFQSTANASRLLSTQVLPKFIGQISGFQRRRAHRMVWVALALCLIFPSVGIAQADLNSPTNLRIVDGLDDKVGGKKWNPGHYMQTLRSNTYTQNQTLRFRYYDQIANEAELVGVLAFFQWSNLEGATRGDYRAGFDLVRAEINKLKSLAIPKRLVIRILDVGWLGNRTDALNHFPAYVRNNPAWLYETPYAIAWKRWNESAMTAYIDMLAAYAKEFDDEPYFEGIFPIRETAPQWAGSTPPSDYSDSGYDSQLRRMAKRASEVFIKSNVWIPVNFLGSQGMTDAYIAYLRTIALGVGGPDTTPGKESWAEKTVRGISGGVDYRGIIPVSGSVELTSFGGWYSFTALEIYQEANNVKKTSHFFWDRNDVQGTTEQRWDTAILPIIRSKPLTNVGCPQTYKASCYSGN